MKRWIAIGVMILAAGAAAAEDRLELIVDAEGVHRQSGTSSDDVVYRPDFDNGGGIGLGLNWHVSGRVSLELKAALLASDMHLHIEDGDFVGNIDVGAVKMMPVTAIVQWHPFEEGALRPYVGVGVAHVFIDDVEAEGLVPRTEFSNPTGLVLDAGLRVPLSKRWSLTGDARYVAVETRGKVRFANSATEGDLDVRPLIVGFGVAYRF